MDLIIFGVYTPPAPTTYDISFSDVKGEESGLEDGTTYLEQVRADVPEIKVGWTNLTQEEVSQISEAVSSDVVNVQYFFGTVQEAEMRKSNRSLKLKFIDDNGDTYWDLSFTLKG